MTGSALASFAVCPSCGAPTEAARALFDTYAFGAKCRVLRCEQCTLVFKDRHPEQSAVARIYGGAYVHFAAAPTVGPAERISAQRKLSACMRLRRGRGAPSGVRVLDIGCGNGDFVRLARELGFEATGVDPFLPEELAGPMLRRGDPEELPAAAYDIVTVLNVAEHVTDPVRLFASGRRLLRSGGVLLVTCPFGDSWAFRRYQARWVHLALDEHLLFWTTRSMEHCLRRAGFLGGRLVRIAGSPFPFGMAPSDAGAGELSEPIRHSGARTGSLQGKVWQLARRIQRSAPMSNAVRWAVDKMRLGDYLEYAVCRD